MIRWDIINHLIKVNGYKTYLEIGYYKGWSFDRVECAFKVAVDPNPCKTPDQEKVITGSMINLGEEEGILGMIYKKTSDEFFNQIDPTSRFDLIFIDGLHESSQVDRDIQNALRHLNPGGTIVMHDCNPSRYEMTTTGTVNGEWTGDVYKSFIRFRDRYEDKCRSYCVDTDYGVGVIKPLKEGEFQDTEFGLLESLGLPESIEWNLFLYFKKELLNLITPEQFLQRETNEKTTTDNNSPA